MRIFVLMVTSALDNTTARRLYDHLGFTLHHVDRAYTVDLAPG